MGVITTHYPSWENMATTLHGRSCPTLASLPHVCRPLLCIQQLPIPTVATSSHDGPNRHPKSSPCTQQSSSLPKHTALPIKHAPAHSHPAVLSPAEVHSFANQACPCTLASSSTLACPSNRAVPIMCTPAHSPVVVKSRPNFTPTQANRLKGLTNHPHQKKPTSSLVGLANNPLFALQTATRSYLSSK
ncbi:hypothetical protein MANES_13G002557v8 [Manihot esculenta]|uniref:Uncharacterized protein n=1 Tax=Manihot esculenta TaxID=3983 RepID=A0ACB7GJP9_MANES|nr:hypothetical protein MANES_13G002557v8 [Manihot esculenta]